VIDGRRFFVFYCGLIVATTFPVAGSIFLTGEAAPSDPYNVFSNAR
jgi:hypothetical protein